MKRISKEKIGELEEKERKKWGVGYLGWMPPEIIAQQQLEDDRKDARKECEALVQGIFERIEAYLNEQIRQCDMGRERCEPYENTKERIEMERYDAVGIEHRRSKDRLQAFKEKSLKKVRGCEMKDKEQDIYEQQKAWDEEQAYLASEDAKAIADAEAREQAELDKEAQEEQLTQDIFEFGAIYPRGVAQHLIALGYRKLPEGKPPLLSDEEILRVSQITRDNLEAGDDGYLTTRCNVAQAQRDSDIKWYER